MLVTMLCCYGECMCVCEVCVQGFIQDFSWGGGGGGNVDASKGCMRASMHSLGFCRFVDIFKDKKRQIQL